MLYFVFRFVPFFIITFIIIILINVHKRRQCKIDKFVVPTKLIVVSVICFYLALCIPFENLYASFNTPSDAYKYQNISEEYFAIEHENVALIVSSDGYTIYRKNENGWRLNWPLPLRKSDIIPVSDNNVSLCIISCKNDDDRFVLIKFLLFENSDTNKSLLISDSINSNFEQVYAGNYNYLYCYVENVDEDYRVFVNGEAYEIE